MCHILHIYPVSSGAGESVKSTVILPATGKCEDTFVDISLLLTESPLHLHQTYCTELHKRAQSDP